MGVDAFFLEMDVWLLRDPRPLFKAAAPDNTADNGGVDMIISTHQENYLDLNAGFYWVQGNERNFRLFNGMLKYLLANPEVWDQSLMSCLMKRESPQPFLYLHAGCDRKGLTSEELAASGLIPNLDVSERTLDLENDQERYFRPSKRTNFSFAIISGDVRMI